MPVAPPEMIETASVEPHPDYADALASEQKESGTSSGLEPESAQATINHG
jgi:hypothetical protein